MTAARTRPSPRLVAGVVVARRHVGARDRGLRPDDRRHRAVQRPAGHGAGRPLLLRARPGRPVHGPDRTGTRSARTRTRRRSPSWSTRSTCCRGRVFVAAWTAILIGAVYLHHRARPVPAGPRRSGAMEIAGGNVSLLLTLAIVAGFRRPWTWAFVLLTKITPGVGLLWFALRREWRQLAIALGRDGGASSRVSYLAQPGAWRDWVALLAANTGKGGTWAAVPDPAARPRPDRRRAAGLGRAAQPALGRAGRGDARPAGAVVRLAVDAAGRHPADDARGAPPRLGAVRRPRAPASGLGTRGRGADGREPEGSARSRAPRRARPRTGRGSPS